MIQFEGVMNGTAIEINQSATIEQKRAALEAALHSHTFARADQLKSFLKYVCEMEFAGRGHELTEYLIGVEALGRPSNYSPSDDSAVRNRAFALRKKLLEFYDHEQPDAALRIELTKGSYCPHFVECPPDQKSNGNGVTVSQFSSPLVPISQPQEISASLEITDDGEKKKYRQGFASGMIFASLVAGLLYLLLGVKQPALTTAHSIAPILTEVWGPILNHGADVLVSVANQPSLSVHPQPSSALSSTASSPPFNDPGGRSMPRELYAWYGTKYPTPPDTELSLTLTSNATYWGDALAAMTTLKTMLSAGASPQLFPEKVITVPTLRRRNVILFGAPEYSAAIAHFLEKCPISVDYLDAIVSTEAGKPQTRLFAVKRDPQSRPVQTYGLITVLPSESSTNQQHRTVIFSGVNSAGTQAAAEFFTSPEHLIELKKQMKKDGHNGFPPAYQVVVRSETDDSILLNFHYETYRAIPIPAGH
jgi:hypothetical protein